MRLFYKSYCLTVLMFSIAVPTKPPSNFSLTAETSTSIEASWQLPPAEDRNGIITGFKLFYKKKGSAELPTRLTINSGSTLTKVVSGLDKYTEYEFQVLAFTSVGDGPNSTVKSETSLEDGKKLILSPFSLIRDFGKQNTRGNASKISVSLMCYR